MTWVTRKIRRCWTRKSHGRVHTAVYDWPMAGHLHNVALRPRLRKFYTRGYPRQYLALPGTSIGLRILPCRFAFHPYGYPVLVQSRASMQAPAVGYHWRSIQRRFSVPITNAVLCAWHIQGLVQYTYSGSNLQPNLSISRHGALASLKILRANPLATLLDGCTSRIVSIMLQVHDGEMA